ncbi:hypothetical protein AGLY_011720 [Aphis glycines]|uniref:Uncharacterized protein n=1 Tax=Aphis glycines TaxID=307491 RepID=A0A6G0TD54_APHGL|nr:hypothetical protein AGLY_011720 [Aphis glycines]
MGSQTTIVQTDLKALVTLFAKSLHSAPNGWPENKNAINETLKPYWTFKEDSMFPTSSPNYALSNLLAEKLIQAMKKLFKKIGQMSALMLHKKCILDSEQNDEYIDFKIGQKYFPTIFRKIQKTKKSDGKSGIFTQNQFSSKFVFYMVVTQTNHWRIYYFKKSSESLARPSKYICNNTGGGCSTPANFETVITLSATFDAPNDISRPDAPQPITNTEFPLNKSASL